MPPFRPALAASAVATLAALLIAPAQAVDTIAGFDTIASDKLSADTVLLTDSGTQLTAPRGWTVRHLTAMLMLDAPEADTHIAIVDVQAADAAGAIQTAWDRYRPGASHPLKLLSARAARDGWDERQVADYTIAPNERAVIEAVASRQGLHWNVLIVDGSAATVEKRGAAVALVLQSARPEGYVAESFAGRQPHALDEARIAQLRDFLDYAIQQLGIPGAGYALMDHNRIIYEGGVGVRELGKKDKVDADTLFMAASNTKGMSTLLLAGLVDDGKLRWDQPVVELYPGFKLGDAATTQKVQVQHLVCACTGLPRQDLEWLFDYKRATPASALKMLAAEQPTSRFGELYQYNNLMAAAAGYIGAARLYPKLGLGPAYDQAMQKRIFDPLEMDSTTFDMAAALRADHASPHAMDIDGKPAVAAMANNYSVVPLRPAGGVWTSAHDLIRYVQLEANNGKLPDGSELVSKKNLQMRRQPGVASAEHEHYGMGLKILDQSGVTVIHHGGSLFGYKSELYLLPDEGIGAVLLTNSDEGVYLLKPFLRRLLELVYDGKPEAIEDVRAAAARSAAERASERRQLSVPATPALAAKLARHYRSAELGELTVLHKGRDTIFDFGPWQSQVATRGNSDGSVSFVTTRAAVDGYEFVAASRQGKRVLIIRDGQHEYVYVEHG